MRRSSAAKYDDAALSLHVAGLVRRAQRLHHRYGSGIIPIGTHDFADLLRRATCEVDIIEPRPGARALTTPPIYGRYHIGVKADLSPPERRFALRHELAHVLAGDVEEPIRMVDRGYMTWAERAADLFALADLVPTSYMRTLRGMRLRHREIRDDIELQIEEQWGPDWPTARLDDRAQLRLRLYRDHGI